LDVEGLSLAHREKVGLACQAIPSFNAAGLPEEKYSRPDGENLLL